jgi:hypothetical protein
MVIRHFGVFRGHLILSLALFAPSIGGPKGLPVKASCALTEIKQALRRLERVEADQGGNRRAIGEFRRQ